MAIAETPRRALNGVYAAGGVSALGTQMTVLALPWLVLETTGSATRAGLVFAAQVLPMVVLGFAGGEVIQRFGAHRTMVVSDLARAPVVALVPFLHALGALTLPALLGIVVVLGALGVPYFAAQRVLAVGLLGSDARALARANSVLEGVRNSSAFVGPGLAGLLIPLLGAAPVVWVNAVTFALSGALLLARVPRAAAGGAGPESGPRGLWAGVRHLFDDGFLGRAMVSTLLFGLMVRLLTLSLPVLAFARFAGDATAAGLLVGAAGAGALAGSLVAVALSARVAPARLAAVSLVLVAAPLWALPAPVPLGVLVAAVAVSSAAGPLLNAPLMGLVSARLPAGYGPKVLQAVVTISTLAAPVSFVGGGVMLDRAGVTTALGAVALLATCAAANLLPALRLLGTPGDSTGPSSAGTWSSRSRAATPSTAP